MKLPLFTNCGFRGMQQSKNLEGYTIYLYLSREKHETLMTEIKTHKIGGR